MKEEGGGAYMREGGKTRQKFLFRVPLPTFSRRKKNSSFTSVCVCIAPLKSRKKGGTKTNESVFYEDYMERIRGLKYLPFVSKKDF